MRRFAISKYHIVLLALLLSAVVFVATAHAQDAAAGDTGAPKESQPASIVVVFRLVMGHLVDPVLWTIAIL
jgi:hypothetical protein